ncbi:male sterility protein-domain-containing protein [Calycina marina]|uniref:Male sterility protein-domain-containing protein n=1 Tax=Calycina marina TaxID=1763456 RepID=A0A9P7Z026_9HELO|nr:male sterility protein-domain-containing protein [Calycina marina]
MSGVQKEGCLVRGKDSETCFARMRETQRKYGIWDALVAHKILTIQEVFGDYNLGPGEDSFADLTGWAAVSIHSGAHVNYVQPCPVHRLSNVIGTVRILRFVSAGKPKTLHYVSRRIACFGSTGLFNEIVGVLEDACPFCTCLACHTTTDTLRVSG